VFGEERTPLVGHRGGDSRAERFTHAENARDWLTPRSLHHAANLAATLGRTRTVTPTAF
jgi:hypothetical protein